MFVNIYCALRRCRPAAKRGIECVEVERLAGEAGDHNPWSPHDADMKPRTKKPRSDIFVWNAKYQVGIAQVDRQHKKLVALINALGNKLAVQADPAASMEVFDDLASYASYHFRTEENLMHECQVDDEFEASHKASHASFVAEVAKARNSAQADPLQVLTKTLGFLSRWLIFHILGTDMRMANEIIALERGLTPAEARNRAIEKMADTHEVLLRALNEMYENLAARNQDFLRANSRLKEELAFHRQAEIQLRKLSLAVEHSPASTFITDAKGVFEYVNPKFVEVTGYSMSDLAGQTPRILKSGDVPDETYAQFWRSIAGKAEWFGEFHNRRKNGELYWDKVSVTPIADADGTVTHYLAIQEDVTARKLAEADLQHSHVQLLASLSELQEQAEDLARLNQASELLQTCATAEEASRAFAHIAEKFTLGSGGALALADAAGESFKTVATWGKDADMLKSFGSDACWGLRRGQPHEVTNSATGLLCSHFRKAPGTSYLCCPLVVQGQVLGLLHMQAAAGTDGARWTRLTQVSMALGNTFKLALTNIRLRAARQG
jgi:hemerythrin-like metal-binding protein/PAS domain S-box-containing protein